MLFFYNILRKGVFASFDTPSGAPTPSVSILKVTKNADLDNKAKKTPQEQSVSPFLQLFYRTVYDVVIAMCLTKTTHPLCSFFLKRSQRI